MSWTRELDGLINGLIVLPASNAGGMDGEKMRKFRCEGVR